MNIVEDASVYKERAHKLCQEFLGGAWKNISVEDLRFNIVQGGLSNKLFYCALPENCAESGCNSDVPKDVLLRMYGPIEFGEDFRLRETTICTLLSERKLGPKVYGLFSDGRLEEYVPSRTLNLKEVNTYFVSIAKELAKIHSMKFPIRKKPLFPSLAYEWLEFAEKSIGPNTIDLHQKIVLSGEYRRELEWVISEMEKVDSAIVFCHNDLRGNNVLLLDSPKPDDRNLLVIDFEYGSYNHRGFDLANHFISRCYDSGMKEDFTFFCFFHYENYPPECQQIEFLNSYLNQLQKEGISFKNNLETERSRILKEISVLKMAVALHWVIGAYKFDKISDSTSTTHYLDFFQQSWKLYQIVKEEYLGNLQTSKD